MEKELGIKALWTYEIDNFVEEETRTEEKDEATGEVKVVVKAEKVNRPDKLIFKRPGRREIETAQEEYAVELSRCVKKGIVTKAMLAKRYRSEGGPLTDEEKKDIGELYSKLDAKQTELVRLRTVEKKKDKTDEQNLLKEITDLRKAILEFESSYQVLFQNTADSKAEVKAIIWYLLNLSYFKAYEDKEPKKLFPQLGIEAQTDAYYEIIDAEGDSNQKLAVGLNKALSVASLLYYGGSLDESDYAQLDKDMAAQSA